MKFVAVLLLSTFVSYPASLGQCKCHLPEPGAKTRTGYFEERTIQARARYRKLAGIVLLFDQPAENVLVELFPVSKQFSAQRTRVAACVTASDGRYCFSRVLKGKYELRASKDGGFEITHVFVSVDPADPRSSNAELTVPIEIGK
jgi:hypothetical protein